MSIEIVSVLWLDTDMVIALHDEAIAEFGGLEGLKDLGLLDSALARPKNLIAYGGESVTIFDCAATLAYGIAKNHSFSDANKRTAWIAARSFLRVNGYRCQPSEVGVVEMTVALASDECTEADFAKWLAENSKPELFVI